MSINVFARWRPPLESQADMTEIETRTLSNIDRRLSVSVKRRTSTHDRQWTSPAAFSAIFNLEVNNSQVYNTVVAPNIPKILGGESFSIFAYGHSGSGKTHTIMGHYFQDTEELGLCLAAAKELFTSLQLFKNESESQEMGIGFSLFELRKKTAFDLLNNHTQCYVREGSDGKVHIRGETETLEGGRVRVRPIVQRQCWEFETFRQELVKALAQRATGSSTVHDNSSRTHAVIELEVINPSLVNARQALFERQSELVPVGKHAIDIMVEEETKSIIQKADGTYAPNPKYRKNQERIDAAETEKAQFEARVTAAERKIDDILTSRAFPCLSAKILFVDLAGAEYCDASGSQLQTTKQTPQERQEGRQINTDLLALKEVMRAWAQGKSRIPYRSSTLTMVLREHFMSIREQNAAIIVTLSPETDQYAATLNSLKYASMVGANSS